VFENDIRRARAKAVQNSINSSSNIGNNNQEQPSILPIGVHLPQPQANGLVIPNNKPSIMPTSTANHANNKHHHSTAIPLFFFILYHYNVFNKLKY